MRIFFVAFGMLSAGACFAGDLVYSPVNPSFGGSPLNSSHLFSEANAQKPSAPVKPQQPYAQQNATQQFVQMLQSRLYSSIAQSVGDAVIGKGAQDSGKITLDKTEVRWNVDALTGNKTIIITDLATMQTTTISVPVVQ